MVATGEQREQRVAPELQLGTAALVHPLDHAAEHVAEQVGQLLGGDAPPGRQPLEQCRGARYVDQAEAAVDHLPPLRAAHVRPLGGDRGYVAGQARARGHLLRHGTRVPMARQWPRPTSTCGSGHLMRNAQADDLGASACVVARGGGLEPPMTGPEPAVLPITPPPKADRHPTRRARPAAPRDRPPPTPSATSAGERGADESRRLASSYVTSTKSAHAEGTVHPMPKITSCLWFDTKGEDAANFYVSVFPNSRIVNVSRYGDAGPGPAGSVMTVDFELDGRPFVALNGGPHFTFNEAVSFVVDCADQDEVDYYWSKLSEGGEEGPCGWLKDRFGLSWQVTPTALGELASDPNPAKAQAVIKAMLGMRKLVVAELQAAYDAA